MKKYLVLFIAVASGLTLSAQSLWNVTYDMSVSLGETKEFIDAPSFRGFGIDGRKFINDDITIGGSYSWNVFYENEVNKSVTEGAATVTANHYNYGNYMPMMFTAHKYFGEGGGVRPFVGTGIGTIWKEEEKIVGSFTVNDDNAWQFGLTPEVGVFIPISNGAMIFLNAKYTYGVQTGELKATSYMNFGIGLAWENL